MKGFIGWILALVVAIAVAGAVAILKYPDTVAGEISIAAWEALRERSVELWQKAREAMDRKGGDEESETRQGDIPAELDQTPAKVEEQVERAVLVEEGWRALEDCNRYSGPKIAGRELRGKVVLVYVWNIEDPDSAKALPRIEQIWQSFKHRKFAVLASHRGGRSDRVKRIAAQKKLSFPFYEEAGFAKEPKVASYPLIYVVDSKGKVVYRGKSDRSATEAVVDAFSRQ